jgi:hypothetical protein
MILKDNTYLRILSIFLIFLIIGCNTENNVEKNNSQNSKNIQKNDPTFEILEGKWFYTNYIDSTIKYRKIYDYIDDIPRDRYELTFNKKNSDSVYLKGYLEGYSEKIIKVDQMKYLLQGDTILLVKQGNNYIINYKRPNNNKKIKKWNNYLFYKKELKIDDIFKYFAKNIFVGEYHDIDRNKTVVFKDNFTVKGIDSTKTYHISEGVSEYSDDMDILVLNELPGQYYWKFKQDTLILQYVYESEDENGPSGHKLGAVKYRLIKE